MSSEIDLLSTSFDKRMPCDLTGVSLHALSSGCGLPGDELLGKSESPDYQGRDESPGSAGRETGRTRRYPVLERNSQHLRSFRSAEFSPLVLLLSCTPTTPVFAALECRLHFDKAFFAKRKGEVKTLRI